MIWLKKLISILLSGALVLSLAGCSLRGAVHKIEEEVSGPTVEVGGQTVKVDQSVEQSGFTAEDFQRDAVTGRITCLSSPAMTGVDVSSHQGDIDWAAVAGDGIEFAMLRVGSRGYSQGAIRADANFETNLAGAQENGLQVGCYFFSQAVTAAEAEEEADFVLSVLNGRSMDLPVVFDWEQIVEEDARTDGMDKAAVTACAAAFCEKIRAAGYRPCFYCNGVVGYLQYDVAQLTDYDAWYAEYDADWPSFAYAFDLWQYSKTGEVAGINGNADLDLFFPKLVEN